MDLNLSSGPRLELSMSIVHRFLIVMATVLALVLACCCGQTVTAGTFYHMLYLYIVPPVDELETIRVVFPWCSFFVFLDKRCIR